MDNNTKTETLYKTIRSLEGSGANNVKLSHYTCTRPETRAPGQRDTFELVEKGKFEFQLKSTEERGAHTNKTIFAHGFHCDRFTNAQISVVMRFRYESVGQNLKPTKPYVITISQIKLEKDKPMLILPAPAAP